MKNPKWDKFVANHEIQNEINSLQKAESCSNMGGQKDPWSDSKTANVEHPKSAWESTIRTVSPKIQ
jgi:hypothetical protein